jgi:hypothetical protein
VAIQSVSGTKKQGTLSLGCDLGKDAEWLRRSAPLGSAARRQHRFA